jgi:Transposase zinc-ribbon domain
MVNGRKPRTLSEAREFFSDSDRCLQAAVKLRWPHGVRCPTCAGKEVIFLATRQVWKCKRAHPGRQFSVKVGTIFEDSAIAMDKWFGAIWIIANSPEDAHYRTVASAIGVTDKTASLMIHRIQLAMNTRSFEKLTYPPKTARVLRIANR